jgi:hypothetical protein
MVEAAFALTRGRDGGEGAVIDFVLGNEKNELMVV